MGFFCNWRGLETCLANALAIMKISSTYSFAYIGSSIYLRTGFPVINRKWNTVSNEGQLGTCNKMNPISKRYTVNVLHWLYQNHQINNKNNNTHSLCTCIWEYQCAILRKKGNGTLKICYKCIEFQNVHLQTCIPSPSWRSRLQCPEMTHCRQRAGWRALFCRI